ncbi:MAG: SGNH/GDSL hydrolase family protein [Acidobacteriota bacterium]
MTLAVSLALAAAVLAALVYLELRFRRRYQMVHGKRYFVALKFPWDKMPVVAHPFLSFAYRKNSFIDINQRLPYDLHPYEYFSFHEPIRINNMGHFGPDFSTHKPADVLRVACLGHSTTGNNIADSRRDYTYPGFLQEHAQRMLDEAGAGRRVEVYNCGIGGWLTADIMIDFMLNIVHTRPDYAVLKLGYNDLYMHLNTGFQTDYTHSRKCLGEVLGDIRKGHRVPKIPFWTSYEFLTDRLFGTGNVRNEVLRRINRKPDPRCGFENLLVERSLVENILVVCRHNGIRPILASFPYYNFKPSELTDRIAQGVLKENALFEELSREFGTPFVDLANLVPFTADYFCDEVHFTPKGMDLVGALFARAVADDWLASRT